MSDHAVGSGHLPATGRALTISAWLTGVYFVIELGIGLYTGSVAVLSDAFHTFSAVGGVLLAIIASRLARLPADRMRTFGWYRAEIIGALINGAFLLLMAIVVIVMGTMRLGSPIALPTGPMLIAAAGGLVTEFISIYLLYRQQGHDLNIRGAFWHILQTFVGSVIIIVAALTIEFTGFLAIDPILGILFGFVLLWASWGIMRDAVHLLMEGTPTNVDLDRVVAKLRDIEHVGDVHHVHAWALTSNRHVFSAHVRIAPEHLGHSAAIQTRVHNILQDDFQFFFSTVQIETTCLDERASRAIDTNILKLPVRRTTLFPGDQPKRH